MRKYLGFARRNPSVARVAWAEADPPSPRKDSLPCTQSIRSRTFAAGALVAAALGLTAAQASAATTAQVQTARSPSPARTAPTTSGRKSASTTLEVDTNGDFIADFSFDRGTFTAIDVLARGGDDKVHNFATLTTRSPPSTGAAAPTR